MILDVLVSERFVGRSGVEAVEALYPDAYLERWHDGLFVSCDGDLNPAHIEIREILLPRFRAVAELIGGVG